MSDIEDIREDFREMRILMHNYFIETDGRFGVVGRHLAHVGDGMSEMSRAMVRVSQRMEHLARQLGQTSEEVTKMAGHLQAVEANSEERWNQLAGRARLQEDRFTRILEGADTRELYARLEERVSRLEQRLDPPAA